MNDDERRTDGSEGPIVGRQGRAAPRDPRVGDPGSDPSPSNRPTLGARRPARPSGAGRRLLQGLAVLVLTVVVGVAGVVTWGATQLRPVDPSTRTALAADATRPDAVGADELGDGTPGSTAASVPFEVEAGWGARRIAQELETAGLVRNGRIFAIWLQLQGLDRGIGEGLYDLTPRATARETAEILQAGGRPRTVRLVIPEGWRATDIAARLEALGIAERERILARIDAPGTLAPAWLPGDARLEGYLYPDTYELRADAAVDDALRVALEHFAAQLDEARLRSVEEAGLTLHAWVTLASMVQAEADGPEEMNIIAGVFVNRLDRGMLLQSDPTVAYGLGKSLPELSAIDGDLEVDHPWNTYTRPGLPLGPIGNPGREALDAVLAPDRTRDDGVAWLYFLHGVDDEGRPTFRPNVDLASHNRDVDRYLR